MKAPLSRRVAIRQTDVNGMDMIFKEDLEAVMRSKRNTYFRLGNVNMAREYDRMIQLLEAAVVI